LGIKIRQAVHSQKPHASLFQLGEQFRIEVGRDEGTVEEKYRPVSFPAGEILKKAIRVLDATESPHAANLMTDVTGMGGNDPCRLVFRCGFPVELAKEGVRGFQAANEQEWLARRGTSPEKRSKGVGQGLLMGGPAQHEQSAEQADVEGPGKEER
jgi:hypothetical protein